MALIKCPECGHDVSSSAESCPNCGYVLHPHENTNTNNANNKQIQNNNNVDMSLYCHLRNRRMAIIIILLAMAVVFSVVGIIYLRDDSNKVQTNSYALMSLIYSIACFIFFIVDLLCYKVEYKILDGNLIIVNACITNHFYINNEKVSMKVTKGRYFNGNLPDGRPIWVHLSTWTNRVTMGFGKKGAPNEISRS